MEYYLEQKLSSIKIYAQSFIQSYEPNLQSYMIVCLLLLPHLGVWLSGVIYPGIIHYNNHNHPNLIYYWIIFIIGYMLEQILCLRNQFDYIKLLIIFLCMKNNFGFSKGIILGMRDLVWRIKGIVIHRI